MLIMSEHIRYPQPDFQLVAEACTRFGLHKAYDAAGYLIKWFVDRSPDAAELKEDVPYEPAQFPSITSEQLAIGDEQVSTMSLIDRVERAQSLVANTGQGSEEVDEAANAGALQQLINLRAMIDAVDPDYSMTQPPATFNELNSALTAAALHTGSERIVDLDQQLALQNQTLLAERIAAEAYCLASFE
jgi:hypothetical protein